MVRRHTFPDYVTTGGILAAAAWLVWMFLQDTAKISTDWQTCRW
jgi:hypothetical protein